MDTLLLGGTDMALSRQQLDELNTIVESRCLALDAEIR